MIVLLGKVKSDIIKKFNLDNLNWYFVDYSKYSHIIGKRFNYDGNTVTLLKVVDQFNHTLTEIPQGYKTICAFDTLLKIEELDTFIYNTNSIILTEL